MRPPTDAEVNAVSKAILKTLEPPSPLLAPTLIEFVDSGSSATAKLLPRQPPLKSMEWSYYERQRLRAFMGQATRMRRVTWVGRLLQLFRR